MFVYVQVYIHIQTFEQISREPKMAWVLRFCLGFRVSGLGESGLVLLGQGENRESSTLGTLS